MTRCLLSETHFAINTLGEVNPCCRYYSDSKTFIDNKTAIDIFNDTRLKKIRENLKNGIRDSGCSDCWNEEDSGAISMRQIHNDRLKDQVISGEPIIDLTSLEIAFSNHCNLKCRHCKTSSSSRWREDDILLGNWVPEKLLQEPNVRHLEIEKLKNLNQIKILGGEPLLSKSFARFIQILDDNKLIQNITFGIVTNGTIFPNDEIIKSLSKSKAVHIIVSVDDIHQQFNYFRTDGDFSSVTNNMKRYEEIKYSNFNFAIHSVINVLNIYRISEIYTYLNQHFSKWKIHFDKIHSPLFLSIDQWSKNELQNEIIVIDNLLNLEINQSRKTTLQQISNILHSVINNKNNFTNLFETSKILDGARNTNLLEVHPIFKNFVGDKN